MACSLASRITSYEAGIHLNFIEVDPATKRTMDGGNYLEIYRFGLVPALRLEDGSLLTENAAILQYLAACSPSSNLVPVSGLELARLHQWLCFVGTQLHKAMFGPYHDRLRKRPLVSRAIAEEWALHEAEVARHRAA